MSRVYIVNDAGHDFSGALRYGDTRALSSGKVNIFATDRLVKSFQDALALSEKGDYLLLSGYAVLNIIAFTILLAKHGEVNVMMYNFLSGEYVLRLMKKEDFNG